MNAPAHVDRTPRLEDFPYRLTDNVRFADLDPNGHVNNAVYATYFETGRVTLMKDHTRGLVPSAKDVELGFSPQLSLEAAIAAGGGFAGVAAAPVASLEYWRLSGGEPAGEIIAPAKDEASLRALAAAAWQGFADLVARFDDAATPYRAVPRPEKAPRYSDYAHLARVKEWSVAEDSE